MESDKTFEISLDYELNDLKLCYGKSISYINSIVNQIFDIQKQLTEKSKLVTHYENNKHYKNISELIEEMDYLDVKSDYNPIAIYEFLHGVRRDILLYSLVEPERILPISKDVLTLSLQGVHFMDNDPHTKTRIKNLLVDYVLH